MILVGWEVPGAEDADLMVSPCFKWKLYWKATRKHISIHGAPRDRPGLQERPWDQLV